MWISFWILPCNYGTLEKPLSLSELQFPDDDDDDEEDDDGDEGGDDDYDTHIP